jgi:phage minor structural protein
MIPILFESTATSFLTNGIGRLSDAVSCIVTEERNGVFELEMQYPETGIHYSDLELFRIVYAIPADGKSGQPFEIYEISKPLNGIVTVRAWHISYALNRIVVKPFTAVSCTAALSSLVTNSTTNNPFTFNTDKNVSATFTVKVPSALRSLLGGQAGSILDVYGKGEYEWDKFTVNFWTNRGVDNGVTIRYGKNLTELTADSDMENVYTGIVPYYWNEETGQLVTTTNIVEWSTHRGDYPHDLVKPVDLSSKWTNETPTKNQLKAAADAYIEANPGWELNTNLRVSFVALADTEEYKDVAALQRVNLCDTVTIIHEGLGVTATAKVVRTVYDVLLERYNEIELGTTSTSLGQAISEQILEEVPTTSDMQRAIANGTALISGNSGGYVVLKRNANGEPEELLIMDTPDILTAQNVWRFNNSGLGFSSTGYGGTYSTAWTIDGTFYANWITAGTMSANRVRTGTIQSYDGNVQIVLGDSGTAGKLVITSGNLQLDSAGNLTITGQINATSGSIGGFTIDNNSIYAGTKGSGTANGDITLGTYNFSRDINSTTRNNLRFAIGSRFGVARGGTLYASNAVLEGDVTATTGHIGGANGLIVNTNKMYYGKSTLTGGGNGIYVGTDGISMGTVGDNFPLMWFDYSTGRVNCFRLDFITDSGSSWTTAHSFVVDDRKRITTGAGMNIGNQGYVTAGGENDTVIGNTTYANVQGISDKRIKKNIRELSEQDSVDFIMGCKPVRFEYVDGNYPAGVHHGLIAQDVQKIVNNWAVVGGSEDTTYALGYTEMIADLIKTVQNQEKRIQALEAALEEK